MLHPQAVRALELSAEEPPVHTLDRAAIERRRVEAVDVGRSEAKEKVAEVEDLTVGGVPCRLYRPTEGRLPVLVHLHGGGFVFGDLETHDGQCRRLANRTGWAVLAVDYRRPPETVFPGAVEDTLAVLAGAEESLGDLDLERLVVLGDSAGANLALVAGLRRPDVVHGCVLVYPFLDPTAGSPSYAATDGGLDRADAEWYWRHYADPSDPTDPDLAPLLSTEFERLPQSLVLIAEHDTLADEDRELVARIETAGAAVEAITYPGMIHGFWRHPEAFDAAEEALAEVRAWLVGVKRR